MIIYTCPKCGHDLMHEILTCNPPIHNNYCSNCGWSHRSTEEIIRVPFSDNNNAICMDDKIYMCHLDFTTGILQIEND